MSTSLPSLPSLEETCHNHLADAIMSVPLLMQEEIIKTSTDIIERRVEARVRKELFETESKKIAHQASDMLASLVVEVMSDYISAMTTNNTLRKNFYEIYSNIDPILVRTAIKTAEEAVVQFEERYVYPNF